MRRKAQTKSEEKSNKNRWFDWTMSWNKSLIQWMLRIQNVYFRSRFNQQSNRYYFAARRRWKTHLFPFKDFRLKRKSIAFFSPPFLHLLLTHEVSFCRDDIKNLSFTFLLLYFRSFILFDHEIASVILTAATLKPDDDGSM